MIHGREVAAVVVAAGSSTRMGFDKLFYQINGVEVLHRAVSALAQHPAVDSIVVVAGTNIERVRNLFGSNPIQKPLVILEGGETRMASVAAGVAACPDASLVAIHDGARPFVSAEVIGRVLETAAMDNAAAPALPVHDTVKKIKDGLVERTVPRQDLMLVQTPQVFDRASFTKALMLLPVEKYTEVTDDCMVMEMAGYPVRLVAGDAANRKITTPEDLQEPAGTAAKRHGGPRVGHGYDVHRLVEGRALILGGVTVPYTMGLLGHSDADVLLHAVSDALLGAAALGDIGKHFPDSDAAYKNADSLLLLAQVGKLVQQAGYQPVNIDATLVCQAPRLSPYLEEMRKNIAGAVGLELQEVSVKATTEEGLGFTGAGQGIAAHCVVMVEK